MQRSLSTVSSAETEVKVNSTDGPITTALFKYADAYFFRSKSQFLRDRTVFLPCGEACWKDYRIIADGQMNETTSFVYGLLRGNDFPEAGKWEGRVVIDVAVDEAKDRMEAMVVYPWTSKDYKLDFRFAPHNAPAYYKRVVIFLSKLFSEPKPRHVPYCFPLHNMIRNYGHFPEDLEPVVSVDDETRLVIQDDDKDTARWYESD